MLRTGGDRRRLHPGTLAASAHLGEVAIEGLPVEPVRHY
jgi:hypothetical protein